MNAIERSGLVTRTSATPGVIENPRTPSRPTSAIPFSLFSERNPIKPRTFSFSSSITNARARTVSNLGDGDSWNAAPSAGSIDKTKIAMHNRRFVRSRLAILWSTVDIVPASGGL